MRMFSLRSFIEGVIKLEGDPIPRLRVSPHHQLQREQLEEEKKGSKPTDF